MTVDREKLREELASRVMRWEQIASSWFVVFSGQAAIGEVTLGLKSPSVERWCWKLKTANSRWEKRRGEPSEGDSPTLEEAQAAVERAWVAWLEHAGLAPILAQADSAERVAAERDEADRRAGAAERRYEDEHDTTLKRNRWLREAKERAGYLDNISFDTVWAETLAKAESLPAAQAENARLSAEVERLRAAMKPFGALADTWVVQTAAQRDELLTVSNGERMCGIKATAFVEAGSALSTPGTDAPAAAQEGSE